MAELIKSVRLEYIEDRDSLVDNKVVKNTYYYNNYKASVFRVSRNERFVGIYINNKETKTDTQASKFIPVAYDKKWNDKTEDELIQNYLDGVKKQIKNLNINIIQNPWSNEAPPIERNYGGSSNIYYLNNGSSIQINWTSSEVSGESSAHEAIGLTVSYPYNLFGETISGPNQPIGGSRWSDGVELEIPNDTPNFQNYQTINGTNSVPYGSKNFNLESGLPIDESGFFGFAANPKQVKNHVISKSIVIQEPSDIDNPSTILIMDDNTFKKSPDINNIKRYPGGVSDLQIIKEVRDNWVKSAEPYGELDICSPNNEFCRIIPYKSPLGNNPIPEDSSPVIPNSGPSQSKVNLSVVLPDDLEIKPRTDIGTIKIYIGEPFDPFADAFNFNDDGYGSDADLLQGELEAEFGGVEDGGEQIFTSEEIEDIRKDESETNNIDDVVSPDNTPGASTGLKSTGSYTSELPKESNKNPKNWKVSYGFNGVPYYGQYDSRWNDVIYGLSNEGTFVEAKVPPKGGAGWQNSKGVGTYPVDWNGSTYKIKCDWYNGNNGFSSILGGGCGITSMSMIINYWMIKLKKGVYTSPVKMAKMACENGARAAKPPCNGTQPGSSLYKKIFDTYGLKMSSIKKSEAESLVKQGIPVMTCGTWKGGKRGDGSTKDQNGGHFIVLTGYDSEGRWRVNDPGSQKGTYYFTSSSNWPGGFWKIVPPNLV